MTNGPGGGSKRLNLHLDSVLRVTDDLDLAASVVAAEAAGLAALSVALAEGTDETALGHAFLRVVALIAALPGRVVVTGIGKSGHVGRKVQSTLASTGTPSIFVHPAEASHGDLGMIVPGDAVLALSNSGESPELADVVGHSRRFAIPLIAMTSRPGSTLGGAADIVLPLPEAQEACAVTAAPTTSTTMQLVLGDALAVTLLRRRGFTASDFGLFHPGGRLGARLRRVADLMHTGAALPLGTPETKLQDAMMVMSSKAFGCLGVVDAEGRLAGLITDADLRRAIDRDLRGLRCHEVMNTAPRTTTPDVLAAEALRDMNSGRRPITSLFVLDPQRRPIGILHVHDLLRAGIA